MNRIREVKPAKGTKGFIIRVLDSYVFRVYNEDFTFVDYDILHYDLEVEILDSDACLYRDEYGAVVDYPAIDELK